MESLTGIMENTRKALQVPIPPHTKTQLKPIKFNQQFFEHGYTVSSIVIYEHQFYACINGVPQLIDPYYLQFFEIEGSVYAVPFYQRDLIPVTDIPESKININSDYCKQILLSLLNNTEHSEKKVRVFNLDREFLQFLETSKLSIQELEGSLADRAVFVIFQVYMKLFQKASHLFNKSYPPVDPLSYSQQAIEGRRYEFTLETYNRQSTLKKFLVGRFLNRPWHLYLSAHIPIIMLL